MSTRGSFLLALGSGGAGFLVAFLLFRSNHDEALDPFPSAAHSRVQFRDPSKKATNPEPPELERPDSRVPALTLGSLDPEPPRVTATSRAETPTTKDELPDPRTLPEFTLEEKLRKHGQIQKLLNERSRPIISQRLQDGLAEHVSDPATWNRSDYEIEHAEIYGMWVFPDGGFDRTVLPRDQYPELYSLKDETLRLEKLILAEQGRQLEQGGAAPR